MGGRRRRFTREFNQEAVRQVLVAGRSAAGVVRELGIRADQLHRRKRAARGGVIRPMPCVRREELRRVRREIARLRAEVAILERAAAVLAKAA